MDLNRTTTISSSRRKTFTVPSNSSVLLPFRETRDIQANCTFSSGPGAPTLIIEDNDMTFASANDSYGSYSSGECQDLAVVKGAVVEAPKDDGVTKKMEVDPPLLWGNLKVVDPALDLEDNSDILDALTQCRNQHYSLFEDCLNSSTASSEPVFETSDVDEPNLSLLDLELDPLKLQETKIKEEISDLTMKRSITQNGMLADITRYEKKTEEFQRKTEQNKKATKEARMKKALLKKETGNLLLEAKAVVDKIDFPRRIFRRFCTLSEVFLCEDENFCREFSGGTCLASRKEPK